VDQLVDLAIPYGISLRMTSHREDCVRVLNRALEKGGDKIANLTKASIYLNISFAKESLGDKAAAIAAAEEVKKYCHQDSSMHLQAVSIIESCTKTGDELTQSLQKLERQGRTAGHEIAANNLALELEEATKDSKESLELLECVLRTREDDYNRIRAVVKKAELLVAEDRLADLSPSNELLLGLAYTYLYSRRLGNLFGRCHAIIWKVLARSKQVVQLLRLFRLSSFIWRLRGETDKEVAYLKDLEGVDFAAILGKDKERVGIEIEYFERRRRAAILLKSSCWS